MLLLTSTTDQLQVVTGVAAPIDVHASWVDIVTASSAITAGRTNTAITTASQTSVAGSPAASAMRNVKTLHVRNKSAAVACPVTVQVFDGSATTQFFVVTLGPGSIVEMTDVGGIRVG